MGNSPGVASDHTYANEVEIVFENDGQKVQAFEVGGRQIELLVPCALWHLPARGIPAGSYCQRQ